jgi:hypothetical protein
VHFWIIIKKQKNVSGVQICVKKINVFAERGIAFKKREWI